MGASATGSSALNGDTGLGIDSTPFMTSRERRIYYVLVGFWAFANLLFWLVWLQPADRGTTGFFIGFTIALSYEWTFLPSVYLYYLGRMRRPRPMAVPPNRSVAMITVCVPAKEQLDVIVKQLAALARVQYPHDSWVLDEGDDPAVREAATQLGVKYFTRKGNPLYNQDGPPFQAKTKAGNVNAWLDAHGKGYEFFVQLDIDHRPRPDYLDRVLGFFADPSVAWVQAPSVYGNLSNWYARGAAEQELVLQGPLQRGFYGASRTPFIIGSHSTYRTKAVLEIGGFQPTRAEDHLDTVVLATHKYLGVFVPEVIATGDGPESFETYLNQQFAWAYSLIQVLLQYTPRYLGQYRLSQAFQLLFAETWYPFWSTTTLFLFLAPDIALLTDWRPSTIDLARFLLISIPISIGTFATWRWSRPWQVPRNLELSWRGVTLEVARWPIVFWALVSVILRRKRGYMITPKGRLDDPGRFSLRSHFPYIGLCVLNVFCVWVWVFRHGDPQNAGYVLFAGLGALWMLALVATNLGVSFVASLRRGTGLLCGVRQWGFATASLVASIILVGSTGLAFFMMASTPIAVSPIRSTVAPSPPPNPAVTPAAPPGPVILAMSLPTDRVAIGAYDPDGSLATVPLNLEHRYVSDDNPQALEAALQDAQNRRALLVTVEPVVGTRPILDDVADGQRDSTLRALVRIVTAHRPQVVYLRWAQEMDLVGLYPWSTGDSAAYRAAYRHLVALFREAGADNVRWVWSPSGNAGSLDYYPGDDVVDYIGVTILEDAGWDALANLPPRTFSDLMREKYRIFSTIPKPIIVAELGVSGDPSRQASWLQDAGQSLPSFPSVRALVYFDAVNALNNHMPTEPDWRVTPEAIQTLLRTVSSPGPAGGRGR